jgi:hypothetical protein
MVLLGIPLIHIIQHMLWLVDYQYRAFSDDIEIAVGNNGGHFDDAILIGIQTSHLKVYPNQVPLRQAHVISPSSEAIKIGSIYPAAAHKRTRALFQ